MTGEEYVPYFSVIWSSKGHGSASIALAGEAMATTAEDNFRIEVWDREEQALAETISRSPDSTVSQAAWQAAIRRRPGMLLIHYNSRHVMEKILTPGEVTIPPQTIIDGSVHAGLDVALGDLREWHVLRAWRRSCSHHATVKPAGLIKRYGKGALSERFFARVVTGAGLSGWKFTSCHAIERSRKVARRNRSLPGQLLRRYWPILSHRRRSAAGLSRTGTARDCGPSASILTQKDADHRGRGQSVPRPVLRPALC
ncbi:hypothetical protein [Mesorhizobium sp. L48C026A00]|uniref:hypothetical protein n=1 Tax=Mesorhizobium sp. L48C026A00 TaxID=1287182 RepID=UPI0003CFE499|nr:hypothetical protein [Mesorhizobium sp. L48C026A00]ESZ05792.1 hypothetical protein X737_35540 [Mesorhizobium sp. L48C026A00]